MFRRLLPRITRQPRSGSDTEPRGDASPSLRLRVVNFRGQPVRFCLFFSNEKVYRAFLNHFKTPKQQPTQDLVPPTCQVEGQPSLSLTLDSDLNVFKNPKGKIKISGGRLSEVITPMDRKEPVLLWQLLDRVVYPRCPSVEKFFFKRAQFSIDFSHPADQVAFQKDQRNGTFCTRELRGRVAITADRTTGKSCQKTSTCSLPAGDRVNFRQFLEENGSFKNFWSNSAAKITALPQQLSADANRGIALEYREGPIDPTTRAPLYSVGQEPHCLREDTTPHPVVQVLGKEVSSDSENVMAIGIGWPPPWTPLLLSLDFRGCKNVGFTVRFSHANDLPVFLNHFKTPEQQPTQDLVPPTCQVEGHPSLSLTLDSDLNAIEGMEGHISISGPTLSELIPKRDTGRPCFLVDVLDRVHPSLKVIRRLSPNGESIRIEFSDHKDQASFAKYQEEGGSSPRALNGWVACEVRKRFEGKEKVLSYRLPAGKIVNFSTLFEEDEDLQSFTQIIKRPSLHVLFPPMRPTPAAQGKKSPTPITKKGPNWSS